MAGNSQNSMPIVAATCPSDRQCVRNGTDVLNLVQDFCSVGGTAGNSGSSLPTQDSTGAQALQIAQQNTAAIQGVLAKLPDTRFATNFAPVPPAVSGVSTAGISWTVPLGTTNYIVHLSFQGPDSNAAISAAFNWWVVQGSQTTTGCTIHFDSAPAKSVGLTFAWAVTAPPNAIASGPTFAGVNPTHAAVGSSVTIYGSGFTGATEVDFNSTPASFTVVSDTVITATVPTGATTGAITIQTGSGSVISTSSFAIP
jgi:hypothetical protein